MRENSFSFYQFWTNTDIIGKKKSHQVTKRYSMKTKIILHVITNIYEPCARKTKISLVLQSKHS